MIEVRLRSGLLLFCVWGATAAYAQQSQSTPTAVVPKLVRFSGSFHPADGSPAQPVESVTMSVYRDRTGGNPLWQEVQNVSVDSGGNYSVLMGATQDDGMPLELFTSAEPRWLGVQFNRPGEAEQPRVLLTSVPYALKASDADTLGGKPASAYVLAGAAAPSNAIAATAPSTTATAAVKSTTPVARVTSGTPNYIGVFVNTTDLGNSLMYQNTGNIGVATTSPTALLHVGSYFGIENFSNVTTLGVAERSSDTVGLSIRALNRNPAVQFCGNGTVNICNYFGLSSTTGSILLGNLPGGYIGNSDSAAAAVISAAGNLGIGTTTPGAKLDVAGNINLSGGVLYQGLPFLGVPGGSAYSNLAVGTGALQTNTAGNFVTAAGAGALQHNTTGADNTATGAFALGLNVTGSENTSNGVQALGSNTNGSYNTALGAGALGNNTAGVNNIAIGYGAAVNVNGGDSNNIHIGNPGAAGDNGVIRIGTAGTQTSFFAAGVRNVTTGDNDAIPVMIDANGQMGTVSSSRRFKEDIQDMGDASRGLMRLRPVIFRYKRPFADGSKPIQYGLIAEEVAEVYPDLVAHSADGQIETVKYQVLDSMLLNEVQRQQEQIRNLEERLAKLEAALASMVPAKNACERDPR